ncbi:MAG TPA: hypothetical protein VJ770_22560 [Stellaceae bacterium]|nr:hypothetical protein [Stellaceae bacterium]
MDVQTIDREYEQLQAQAQETIGKLQTLADKLRAANLAGNPDAREWMLDRKEITLAVREEQDQVGALLQALHGFVTRQAEQMGSVPQTAPASGPWSGQPQSPPGSSYPLQPSAGGGGMFGSFLNSGFGRAAAAGAGFGIGDTVISRLFGGCGGCWRNA